MTGSHCSFVWSDRYVFHFLKKFHFLYKRIPSIYNGFPPVIYKFQIGRRLCNLLESLASVRYLSFSGYTDSCSSSCLQTFFPSIKKH